MKANEYIKNYGWICASIKIAKIEHSKNFDGFYLDLKRLVESHELVGSYGGLDKAKLRCYPAKHLTMQSYHTLRGAVADVESCQ